MSDLTATEEAVLEAGPGTIQVLPAEVGLDAQIAADIPATWVAAWRLARRIHQTPFVPSALRGHPESVLACILTGDELGLGPMQSLRMVNVIEGRPAASAELMRALVNRAGHRIDVVESRQDRVTLAGRRRDTGAVAKVTWTIGDAQRAKLTGNPAWAKYPRSMLLARATSELCRALFADVIGGLYTPEETAAIEGRSWEPSLGELGGELVDPVTLTTFDTDEVQTAAESVLDLEEDG
jgi:hypothetical protein